MSYAKTSITGIQKYDKAFSVYPSGHNCEMEPGVCTIIRPCKNGASCVGSRNEYSCNCPLGFAGQHCEHSMYLYSSFPFELYSQRFSEELVYTALVLMPFCAS